MRRLKLTTTCHCYLKPKKDIQLKQILEISQIQFFPLRERINIFPPKKELTTNFYCLSPKKRKKKKKKKKVTTNKRRLDKKI